MLIGPSRLLLSSHKAHVLRGGSSPRLLLRARHRPPGRLLHHQLLRSQYPAVRPLLPILLLLLLGWRQRLRVVRWLLPLQQLRGGWLVRGIMFPRRMPRMLATPTSASAPAAPSLCRRAEQLAGGRGGRGSHCARHHRRRHPLVAGGREGWVARRGRCPTLWAGGHEGRVAHPQLRCSRQRRWWLQRWMTAGPAAAPPCSSPPGRCWPSSAAAPRRRIRPAATAPARERQAPLKCPLLLLRGSPAPRSPAGWACLVCRAGHVLRDDGPQVRDQPHRRGGNLQEGKQGGRKCFNLIDGIGAKYHREAAGKVGR